MPTTYDEADIRALLGAANLTKGQAYANDGRIHLEPPQHEGDQVLLHARINGSGNRQYETWVRIRQARNRVMFDNRCSCPVKGDCKHVAGVLVLYLSQVHPESARRLEEARRARERTLIDLWLLQIADGDLKQPKGREELRLLLGRQSYRTWGSPWELTLMRSSRLRGGELGKLKIIRSPDINALRQQFPQLAPFLTVFAGEQRAQGGYGATLQLQGVGGMVVLHAAISSGVCHLDSLDNPPLQMRDAVRTTPRWVENDDGGQQLVVGEPHWQLLPVEPLHAIDPTHFTCFAVDCGLPGLSAATLAKAPVIPPELADDVAESVASNLPRLPLPRSRIAHARQDLLPTPVLVIGNLDPEQPRLEGARLFFEYGTGRVSADDPSPRVSLGKDAMALRQRDLEQQYIDMLEQELNTLLLKGSTADVPLRAWGDIDLRTWIEWRQSRLPAFIDAGWQVDYDTATVLDIVDDPAIEAELKDGQQGGWFDLALGIDIDGQRYELLPMLLAGIASGNLRTDEAYLIELPLKDGRTRIVRVPAARLGTMVSALQELAEGRSRTARKLSVSTLNAWSLSQIDGVDWRTPVMLGQFVERLKTLAHLPPRSAPDGFNATLRPYQETGLARLQFWREHQLNGILADDMGLGKTLQTLAHILIEKQEGRLQLPALVIAPTSVVGNWRAEARRFTPALRLLVLHGSDRHSHFEHLDDADLVITSYALLLRDLEKYRRQKFHLLVLDEAQTIKNRQAKVSEAVRFIDARHRLCLTGTPMENNLGELWSLFDFLMPGLLGNYQRFSRIYRVAIEKAGDPERAQMLARRVAPFMLRRTKQEVATELPAKTEMIRTIDLEGAQRDLYETVRVAVTKEVQAAIRRRGQGGSHIEILDALLKLRQVCCDPRLVKLESAQQVRESAKLSHLEELLPTLVAEGRRILLFSQFVEMLTLIEDLADALGIPYLKLTGASRNREKLVARFQAGDVPLFLISLKAGGVGINLTAADTVIHYDPWWNPAVENQATDRAYRIGQDKPVFVYKLVTAGTVEEQILAMQARKQALASGIHDAGEDALALDDQSLEALLQPMEAQLPGE